MVLKNMCEITAEMFIANIIKDFKIENPDGNIFTKNTNLNNVYLFFRGHSDLSWKLLPNCARKNNKSEYDSLKEDDFNVDIEKLTIWQHYQDKYKKTTRLLDFTTSLKVALYFACCDNFDKDGTLYIMKYAPDYYKSDRIKEAIFYLRCRCDKRYTNKDIYEIYREEMNKIGLEEKNYFSMICEINDTFSYGRMIIFDEDFCKKIGNDRLIKQKGALFYCPSLIEFNQEKDINKEFNDEEIENLISDISSFSMYAKEMEYYIHVHKIREPKWLIYENERPNIFKSVIVKVIPRELKTHILNYLKRHGITKESLGL